MTENNNFINLFEDINLNKIPEVMFQNDSYIIPINLISNNKLPSLPNFNDKVSVDNLDFLFLTENVKIILRIVNNNIHVEKNFFLKKIITGIDIYNLLEEDLRTDETIEIKKISLNNDEFIEKNNNNLVLNNEDILYILINNVLRINCNDNFLQNNLINHLNPINLINNFNENINESSNNTFNENLNDELSQIINILNEFNTENEETFIIPETLSKKEINNIESNEYQYIQNNIKETNCSICQTNEDFKENDIICSLPCNHHFHQECLHKWFENYSNFCPLCRKKAN